MDYKRLSTTLFSDLLQDREPLVVSILLTLYEDIRGLHQKLDAPYVVSDFVKLI
jgi:hypothetical protein